MQLCVSGRGPRPCELRHTVMVEPERGSVAGGSPYSGAHLWLLLFLPVAGAVVGVATDRSEFMLVTATFWSVGALVTAALVILVSELLRGGRIR